MPSQLERTTGARTGRTANLAPRAAGARDGRGHGEVSRRRAAGRAAHRSGQVSGVRPSDRRGPGPAGHRGRNVRSTSRCSYNLRITRRRADSCGLHRSTSQVIRRSGSGVCVCVFVIAESSSAGAPGRSLARTYTIFRSTIFVGGRGARAVGVRDVANARGHGVGLDARDAGVRWEAGTAGPSLMILPQVHLRKPCYDFYFL